MRWSHRQLVAKVKQLLEEVFGIPVICAPPAYTSRFDARYSIPGFRAKELRMMDLEYLMNKSTVDSKLVDIYRKILDNIPQREFPKGAKLIMPDARNGGEYFVFLCDNKVKVTNADINAATNIAWRGIASPLSLDLLHRVRLEKKKSKLQPKFANQREKALLGKFEFTISREIKDGDISTAFCLTHAFNGLIPFATYGEPNGKMFKLVHSKLLRDNLRKNSWAFCNLYNYQLLVNVSSYANLLKDYIENNGWSIDADGIPL